MRDNHRKEAVSLRILLVAFHLVLVTVVSFYVILLPLSVSNVMFPSLGSIGPDCKENAL